MHDETPPLKGAFVRRGDVFLRITPKTSPCELSLASPLQLRSLSFVAQGQRGIFMNIDTLLQGDLARSIAALDAQLLLAHVLGISRVQLLTWPLQTVSIHQQENFQALVRRRAQGEPLAYLVGSKEFWSFNLRVNAAVLVPRPETECLVEALLTRFPLHDPYPTRVLDLGTGSGAIALALAVERPHWQITAIDRSEAALEVAQYNAAALSLENISFVASDWFSGLELGDRSAFDIIVSNPPYIKEGDRHLLQDGLCHEPIDALVAGFDGLSDLQRIIAGSPLFLKPRGVLALEHGATQGFLVRTLMKKHGFTRKITLKDLGGLDRFSLACLKGFPSAVVSGRLGVRS